MSRLSLLMTEGVRYDKAAFNVSNDVSDERWYFLALARVGGLASFGNEYGSDAAQSVAAIAVACFLLDKPATDPDYRLR